MQLEVSGFTGYRSFLNMVVIQSIMNVLRNRWTVNKWSLNYANKRNFFAAIWVHNVLRIQLTKLSGWPRDD